MTIRLTGSPAFSITSDRCTGKSIGQKLSCWVGVAYAPRGAGANDSATLRATGEDGTSARLSLSGCSPGGHNHIFWVGELDGALSGVPRDGHCITTVAAAYGATDLAVNGTHVYWVTYDGAVKTVPLDGGSVTTLATGQKYPGSVAVDGTRVYWTNGDDGTVNEVPVGGGSVTTIASGQNDPVSIAVEGGHVYWADYKGGTVNTVPIGGGSVTTLVSGQDEPLSLAVDATHVYWANVGLGSGGGTVNEIPLGGGSVTVLDDPGWVPFPVVVAGGHVYWATCCGGSLYQVPVGGGTVTTLADNPNTYTLAVDGTRVYWIDEGSSDPKVGGPGRVNEVPIGGGGGVTTLARVPPDAFYTIAVSP